MPNIDGSPTVEEITKQRTEVFASINNHNQSLLEKEFIDYGNRDKNDVKIALKNMRKLSIMERDIGRYEDDGQRARSLLMLSKSVSHLYFRSSGTHIDPLGLYTGYKKIEERSIWSDLDFLSICGEYGKQPQLRITPQIIKNILEEDIPKLKQILDAEIQTDDNKKETIRSSKKYGDTKNLSHLYNIVNFHRTKQSLDKALILLDQAINTNFDLYHEKHRFAFCRLLTEIGECYTKKNLTDTAKKFFNDDDLNSLSKMRNGLTHFNAYLAKENDIFSILRKPENIDKLSDILSSDLIKLRDITIDAMRTLNFDNNISDIDFETHVSSHFDYTKQRTIEKVREKLNNIKNNDNNPVLSEDTVNQFITRLTNSGIILNNIQNAQDYVKEIKDEIRKVNPRLLGEKAIKSILTEINYLANEGIKNFRNDPKFSFIEEFTNLLLSQQDKHNIATEVLITERKIDTINTMEYMLRPVPFTFKEMKHSFVEDVIVFGVNPNVMRAMELNTSPLNEEQKRSYRIAVFNDNLDERNRIALIGINSIIDQDIINKDTAKYNMFNSMCENIKNDFHTKYASIYIKEVKPQLQAQQLAI